MFARAKTVVHDRRGGSLHPSRQHRSSLLPPTAVWPPQREMCGTSLSTHPCGSTCEASVRGLAISQPGDRFEAEAERIADEVMSFPERAIQSQPEGDDAAAEAVTPGLHVLPPVTPAPVPTLQRAVPEFHSFEPHEPGGPFGRDIGAEPSPPTRHPGETLPFREATEFVECIRFFNQLSAPPVCEPDRSLTWNDFPEGGAGSPRSAWTRPDLRLVSFSLPPDICTAEVLGEPLRVRQKFQAFLDRSVSWVKPNVKHASDPAQNDCDAKIAACEQFFDTEAAAGRTGGTYQLTTPGACAAAVPAPSEQATERDECSSVLGPACTAREEAESQRLLRHEQIHFDFGCLLAEKANAALARRSATSIRICWILRSIDRRMSGQRRLTELQAASA